MPAKQSSVKAAPSPAAAAPAAAGPTSGEYLPALGLFIISSVGMMLINKLAMAALPLPSTMMLIQLFATIALLYLGGKVDRSANNTDENKKRAGVVGAIVDAIFSFGGLLDPAIAKRWSPIALLFATMIYTSASSFLHASVSSILVFRNVTAIISTVVDFATRGIKVNAEIVLSEIVIVAGAVLYGGSSATFTAAGLFWMLLNCSAQVAYGVLLKREIDVNPKVKTMQKYTMSLYNNVMAAPLIVVIFFLQGEHVAVFGDAAAGTPSRLAAVTANGWIIIALSCVFGYLISTSGFGLQRLVSATTFIVVNNLAKFVNITLGMLFLNEKISGSAEWCGCILAFAGGFWYSMATQRFAEQQKKLKQK